MLKRQEAFILIPQARWCTVIPLGALVWIYCILNRREDPSKSPTSQTIDFFSPTFSLWFHTHVKKETAETKKQGLQASSSHSPFQTKYKKVQGSFCPRRSNHSKTQPVRDILLCLPSLDPQWDAYFQDHLVQARVVGCKFVIKTTGEPDAPIGHQASQQSLRDQTRTLPFVPTMGGGAQTALLAHSRSRKNYGYLGQVMK